MDQNGRPKERKLRYMSMTFCPWLVVKPYPMGSTIWSTRAGLGVLGIDHETAEFAVESMRRWWHTCGKKLYPHQTEVLITTDAGGSNGAKSRL